MKTNALRTQSDTRRIGHTTFCCLLGMLVFGCAGDTDRANSADVIDDAGVEADTPGADSTGDVALSAEGCPEAGGTMRRLAGGYCIDLTEVTRGDYFDWLATEPDTNGQSTACSGNADFLPACLTTGGWGLDRVLDNPVSCLDWCDAAAYCEAHGKRLCGDIDTGGAVAISGANDAAQSEWFAACTSGGANDYPYGDNYEQFRCYESPETGWASIETASLDACQSPDSNFDGIYDLSGNVAEWENACDSDSPDGACRIRGGSYKHSGIGVRCDAGQGLVLPRLAADDAVGFRCCATAQ